MALTALEIRNARPNLKPTKDKDASGKRLCAQVDGAYKLWDEKGLFVSVTPNGSKLWRLKYRYLGKEKLLALGSFEDVSPVQARAKRDEARRQLAMGIDPGATRRLSKLAQRTRATNTVGGLAEAWYQHMQPQWAQSTADKVRFYLDKELIRAIGTRPVEEITTPVLVEFVQRIEKRNAFDVAKKMRGWLNQIFKYGGALGIITVNPARDLAVVATKRPAHKSMAHLPLEDLAKFLVALDSYKGHPFTRMAAQLLLLTAVRPGELRKAPWTEFDLENAQWLVPAERMKMRRPHVVPLPSQAIEILRELQQITGTGHFLFPGRDSADRPISENTLNKAFHRMGYHGQQTGHGFRHIISTALNESGYPRDWVEQQLAHGDEDYSRGRYNHARYSGPRRQMMQKWADFLDSLKSGQENMRALMYAASMESASDE